MSEMSLRSDLLAKGGPLSFMMSLEMFRVSSTLAFPMVPFLVITLLPCFPGELVVSFLTEYAMSRTIRPVRYVSEQGQ